jgi:hypothetical protein
MNRDFAPMLPCFQLLNLSTFLCSLTVYKISKGLSVRITENVFIYYMTETLTNMPTIFITVHIKQLSNYNL